MNPSVSASSLAYDKVPDLPGVFLRYVRRSGDVLRFYQHPPDLDALSGAARTAAASKFPREEMAAILRLQNEGFEDSQAVQQAIADLARPDSVAVLTGQQVGLFTGPALTAYKALTAIRLSEELRRMGFRAVPLFWMASDDHDLAEVTRLAAWDPDAGIRQWDARPMLFGAREMPPHPVGSMSLPDSVRTLIDRYASCFPRKHDVGIVDRIASACRPGATFAEAFGRLMAQLFRDRGLVIFDPRNSGAKRLASPVIRTALSQAQGLRSRLAERNGALTRAGLAPQVALQPRATLVFLEEDGQRRLLFAADGGFGTREGGRRFPAEELLERTDARPEDFSPSALLRPLVQDHLFPTAAYVGGPAEISYFAQAEVLYRAFGRPMPVIWPRSSFTILGTETCAAMRRRALRVEDCFLGEEHVVRKIGSGRAGSPASSLNELRIRVGQDVDRLRPALVRVDPTLGPAADTVRRKLVHRLSSLEIRLLHAESRSNPEFRRELSDILDGCFPAGSLQERTVGVHPLLARFGTGLLDNLYGLIDLGRFEHLVVCLAADEGA